LESPNPSAALIGVAASLVLVLLNAFFVASEFAIVKVRRTRLEELAGQGVSAARISILCVDQLDEYLSATQLGITLVSLALGWIGEEAFFELFALFYPALLEGGSSVAHAISTGLSFSIITLLHVVLGELVPKSMAIQKAEKITLWVSPPLRLFYKLARPLIHGFTTLANLILRRMGYHDTGESPLSEEELKLVMKDSREEGVISESEAQIINKAFSFSDKRAGDIMIPAERVKYLSLQRGFEQNMAVTRERMHTRFPLASSGFDSIVGVVHVKDVLHWPHDETTNSVFERVARPPIFIDPGMRQDQVMKLLKERHAHLAIVQDSKTKRNLGVVTMEDILEELVGEILDEHGN
jgi:CBS domain containing-hemolysin-like protein